MKVVSWNVNSIRARYDRVLNWLDANEPDVVCLQELKCQDGDFPYDAFSSLGYMCSVYGQKSYNGVAILSFDEPKDVVRGFGDGVDDPQARTIAATIDGVRIVDLYVPNGGKVGSDKWRYKLTWYDRLVRWLGAHCDPTQPLVVCGDFNIAPEDFDVARPDRWRDTAMCAQPGRDALARVVDWGLVDTFRQHHTEGGHYSWWDYRPPGFKGNDGLRIDQIYVTPSLAEACAAAGIDIEEREDRPGSKASDHAPIWADFEID